MLLGGFLTGASTSLLAKSNLSAFRSVLQDSEGLVATELPMDLSGEDDSKLARHRRQGHIPFNPFFLLQRLESSRLVVMQVFPRHIPFNPDCLECAKGRSVFQHRRDKGDRKEVSIQADFAFLNTTGEIVRRTPRFSEDPCVD